MPKQMRQKVGILKKIMDLSVGFTNGAVNDILKVS